MIEHPEPEAFIPRRANMRRSGEILRLALAWYRRKKGEAGS